MLFTVSCRGSPSTLAPFPNLTIIDCENCQTEVAAEVAADGTVTCGNCGETLTDKKIPPPDDPLRSAQELLDRWSKEPLLEPLSPPPGKEANHLSESENSEDTEETDHSDEDSPPKSSDYDSSSEETPQEAKEQSAPTPEPPPEKKPKFRFDAAHLPDKPSAEEIEEREEKQQPAAEEENSQEATVEAIAEQDSQSEPVPPTDTAEATPEVGTEKSKFQPRRLDGAQPVAMSSEPHIDVQRLIDERLAKEKKGVNWLVLAGQWLSYLGVLGLTAGAAIIVYGYFGGNPEMTPKGWMLTTAGQMLLLLGIVTLISGGLEQSNDEVNTRIEWLGEQMLRFEQETKEQLLRGPKIHAAQYGDDAKARESQQSTEKNTDSR